MRGLLLLVTASLAFGLGAFAQMLPADAGMTAIDGSVTPELIPDMTAYRLLFVSLAEQANPPRAEIAAHKAHLARTQLGDVDGQALADVLRMFKQQYDDLIKSYNALADVAIQQGNAPDYAAFLVQRDAIVRATLTRLESAMSPEGVDKLQAFVKGEKRKMKIQPAH